MIALFGSGETSTSGRKVFERLLKELPQQASVALLETPAGFELNSGAVIGRIAEFLRLRLQNYDPQPVTIPARRKGGAFSVDDPRLLAPLLEADLIFMGPGSPSYAVRQLQDSLAWEYTRAGHRLGTPLALASAAVIAISVYALPVYEIYKVGEDPHWKPGLDLLGEYGLPLVFVPHWNNNDGGAELDTRYCFMGESRFANLLALLPPELTVVGIDENTALLLDPALGTCQVIGADGVTLIHTGHEHPLSGHELPTTLQEAITRRDCHVHRFNDGSVFSLSDLGTIQLPDGGQGLSPQVWVEAQARRAAAFERRRSRPPEIPVDVQRLADERQQARLRKDWPAADTLRKQIEALGWLVEDTPDGPRVKQN